LGDAKAILAGETRGGARGTVVRAAVAGSTGYAGRELVALLARHPAVRITRLMSSGRDGRASFPIEQSHPALRGLGLPACGPLKLEPFDSSEADVVFLATPHEASLELVPALVERGLRVIDLSGAFRLQAQAYPRWYGFEHHAAGALAQAVYGLPELDAEAIRAARLVANPGCYATSSILALAPLVEAGALDLAAGIVCDSKSGASGAGRAPSAATQFAEVNENLRAYKLFTHRHVPEILQALGLEESRFTFTPHLLPITRGILSTVYARLARPAALAQLVELFQGFYARSPLVRVYPAGELPEIQSVAHTNFADLGLALGPDGQRLIVVSALDNLGKGAAGQAVQNMNLMFGLDEEAGLA
jgi:N-acetyl-gamma-glutamyl-phosphate reductase